VPDLEDYLDRRDLDVTPEPGPGDTPTHDPPVFVIHEHDASTHHLDLRLEVDGVLRSWAVPKGPSTDPRVKRLAIQTEDHPLSYADFEGVIPEDEYGGGTTLVWDAGTFTTDKDDFAAALDEGEATFALHGEKLTGGYALVRIEEGDQPQWLLIKRDDDGADARRRPTSTEPESVLTGRDLDAVAAEEGPDDG
jgi:DNA ligase D-like protein (predicted 3'-phosphoesterase)